MGIPMTRIGVVAAVLVSALAFLAGQAHTARRSAVEHTCAAVDKQFIADYRVQAEGLALAGDDYFRGDADADTVAEMAESAAHVVRGLGPFDPSLRLVKRYAPAMFLQFGAALEARSAGLDDARQMYVGYTTIGSRVQDVLRDAHPALAAMGCDVSDLLQ